jgi:hypothetical protein
MGNLNVLLISYSFPPAGGVGVMRAASFARYFPAENIRLDVLTARNASAVGTDPTLLRDISDEVTIHRTITFDIPFGIKKRIKAVFAETAHTAEQASRSKASGGPHLFKRIIQELLQPDPQVTWLPILTRAARRIIKKRDINLVLITVPPFSCGLLVEKLRREFPRLAIVVDFRDEWISTTFSNVSFLLSSSNRSRNIAQRIESGVITNATAIVTVTEAARREIRSRYPQEPAEKFLLVPNGFDATKLPVSTSLPEHRQDGKIIVTYLGTIYSSTEPTALIGAVRSLPEEVRSKFVLRFIGHIEEPRFRSALLELGDMVELKGYIPQREALAAMAETDYVLLINHDPLNVGGKFYDYVGGGKPILGTVHPEGETRRLLEELRAGWWAGNNDVNGIRQLFIDAAARGISLSNEFKPDVEKIAYYERKALARRYAAILHLIAGKQRDHNSESGTSRPSKVGE